VSTAPTSVAPAKARAATTVPASGSGSSTKASIGRAEGSSVTSRSRSSAVSKERVAGTATPWMRREVTSVRRALARSPARRSTLDPATVVTGLCSSTTAPALANSSR
jgi:hypothetical protein